MLLFGKNEVGRVSEKVQENWCGWENNLCGLFGKPSHYIFYTNIFEVCNSYFLEPLPHVLT